MKTTQLNLLFALAFLLFAGTTLQAQQSDKASKKGTYIIIQKNTEKEKVIKDVDAIEDILIEFDVDTDDRQVVKDFMRGHSPQSSKPFLGVYSSKNHDGEGIILDGIVNESAAQKAGLQKGDIITTLNSVKLTSVRDLIVELKQHQPDEVINIKYIRDGNPSEMSITLGSKKTRTHHRSYSYTSKVERDPCAVFIGVYNSSSFNPRGVKVSGIISNTPASEANLMKGDYITAMDGVKVNSHRELLAERNKHQPGDKFVLTVTRDGVSQEVQAQFKSCDEEETPIIEEIVEETKDNPIVEMPAISPAINSSNALKVEGMEAYPNPTYGDLNLKFQAEAKPITVRIVDIQGRVVFNETLNSFNGDYNRRIDLSDGTPGVLSISIVQEGKVFTKNIILLARA